MPLIGPMLLLIFENVSAYALIQDYALIRTLRVYYSFKSLREVRLSANRLEDFPRVLTSPLPSLEIIDLSINRITSLENCNFAECMVSSAPTNLMRSLQPYY